MTFVNFSNHPSEKWSEEQLMEAKKWGKIVDVPFPAVQPISSEKEIQKLAEEQMEKIMACQPEVVMCQGEFTLSYQVICMLKENGVRVVAACSERRTIENPLTDDITMKTSTYKFVRFREY